LFNPRGAKIVAENYAGLVSDKEVLCEERKRTEEFVLFLALCWVVCVERPKISLYICHRPPWAVWWAKAHPPFPSLPFHTHITPPVKHKPVRRLKKPSHMAASARKWI